MTERTEMHHGYAATSLMTVGRCTCKTSSKDRNQHSFRSEVGIGRKTLDEIEKHEQLRLIPAVPECQMQINIDADNFYDAM